MNKEIKSSILSIIVLVLVITVSVLTYHYTSKNTTFKNINENINVKTNTNKESTLLNIDNKKYKIDSYDISVETDKFYHFKIVLETNDSVIYEVYLNNKKLVEETFTSDKVSTLYEGEFQNKKENYRVVIKGSSEDSNNKLSFVY